MTITTKQLNALRVLCDLAKHRVWVSTHAVSLDLGIDSDANAGLLLSHLVRHRPALAEKQPGKQIAGKWRLTAYRPTAEGLRVARGGE